MMFGRGVPVVLIAMTLDRSVLFVRKAVGE
jgi:hypothetical protein